MKFICCVLFVFLCFHGQEGARLTTFGSHFRYNGQRVYLSGVNQAWYHFASDFGNHKYSTTHIRLEDILQQISLNGGNSIRIWVHTDSEHTPKFGNTGHVTAADKYCNHIIKEMQRYLCKAQEYNIFVFFVLWNGADWNFDWGQQLNGLITVPGKLESYINKALIPIVKALKGYPSLGGYDIMNEPEGIVIVESSPNPNQCLNTHTLTGTGAGWKTFNCLLGSCFFMHALQRFINWQAHFIKVHDPQALVTVGSWRENSQNSNFFTPNSYNFYSDTCLHGAGGYSDGVLDFYQIHTYADNIGVSYSSYSPMVRSKYYYFLSKPVVIGEYSSSASDGRNNQDLADWAYTHGYAGAWSWHANDSGDHTDNLPDQLAGLAHISGRPYISVNLGTCTLTTNQLNDAIRPKPTGLHRFCRAKLFPVLSLSPSPGRR